MGSAERDTPNSEVKAKGSGEKDALPSAAVPSDAAPTSAVPSTDRPALMSPPQRPIRPVRPAAPEVPPAAAVKPPAKTPEVAVTSSPSPTVELGATDPAAYRYQPIAPPSEPMQYRAIGLVRGTYEPSEPDQLNRGNLTTDDGHVIDSVLLGRITSLVKKHLDLSASHLWVVYPRTRREMDNDDQDLHLQIVGVWEPETLGLPGETPASDEADDDGSDSDEDSAAAKPDLANLPPVDDNFFSIRGEVVKYDPEEQEVSVKILQGVKGTPGSSKSFKLLLQGSIEGRTVGYFWDFKVKRDAKTLMLMEATVVGIVPPKKRPKGGGGGPRHSKPGLRSGPGGSRPPMPNRRPTTGVKVSDSGTDRLTNRPKKREEPRDNTSAE